MSVYNAEDLARWSGGAWLGRMPDYVSGVSNDTRTITSGNLYFAIRGPKYDGHDFLDTAFLNGASAAVVAGASIESARPDQCLLAVDDTSEALKDIAAGYRARVNPEIVGITGSAGKSSVKELLSSILGKTFKVSCTKGNWNNDIGLPLSMLSMAGDTRIGVFELGTNHPGEIAELCRILSPGRGLITNIGAAHIEYFGSVSAIAREKGALLEALPADGIAVLNRDGPQFECLGSMCRGEIVDVSLSEGAAYYADNIQTRPEGGGVEFTVHEKKSGDSAGIIINLPGVHNVYNALEAIAIARSFGEDWGGIRDGIIDYTPLPLRWQESVLGGVKIINDSYNANPLSMRASIKAFTDVAGQSGGWLLLGGMMELGAAENEEHRALGRFLAEYKWQGVLTVGESAALIAEGAAEAGFSRKLIHQLKSLQQAAELLSQLTNEGDCVLIKGSRGAKLEEVVDLLSEQKK